VIIDFSKVTVDQVSPEIPVIRGLNIPSTGPVEIYGPEVGPQFWPFAIQKVIDFVELSFEDNQDAKEAFSCLVKMAEERYHHVLTCTDCRDGIRSRFLPSWGIIDQWTAADWVYFEGFESIISDKNLLSGIVDEFETMNATELIEFFLASGDPTKMLRALMLTILGSDPE
jgi:hypothetical protein